MRADKDETTNKKRNKNERKSNLEPDRQQPPHVVRLQEIIGFH